MLKPVGWALLFVEQLCLNQLAGHCYLWSNCAYTSWLGIVICGATVLKPVGWALLFVEQLRLNQLVGHCYL